MGLMLDFNQSRVNTPRLSLKSHYPVGWVVERIPDGRRIPANCLQQRFAIAGGISHNPTLSRILLGFAIAQPNLHFLNRQVLNVYCRTKKHSNSAIRC